MPPERPDRESLTPVHNTGTFAVFAESSREWAQKCEEIAKDPTREMKDVRLAAATLAVRLRQASDVFDDWLRHPDRRPDVVGRGPIVSAYQDLAAETIRFLGRMTKPPPR